jgi:hypothetical protein
MKRNEIYKYAEQDTTFLIGICLDRLTPRKNPALFLQDLQQMEHLLLGHRKYLQHIIGLPLHDKIDDFTSIVLVAIENFMPYVEDSVLAKIIPRSEFKNLSDKEINAIRLSIIRVFALYDDCLFWNNSHDFPKLPGPQSSE